MSYDRLWERLLEFLNSWCQATEVEPGRIEVAVKDTRGQAVPVEILMTRDEWDAMVTISWGDFDTAAQEVRRALITRSYHERYLIYGDYQLVASAAPTLTTDPHPGRPRDQLRQNRSRIGRWVPRSSRDHEEPGEATPD